MKSHTKRMLSLILALILSFSLCLPAIAAGGFSDVPATHWAYQDIMACAEQGIVQGFSDGTFRPEEKVTDVQFIVMMTRTFYAAQLNDVAVPAGQPWYYANVKVAEDVGMLKYGVDTLTMSDSAMNRYDMAFVLSTTLFANNMLASLEQRNAARDSIKDATSIPNNRTIVVYNAYHFGIITGMADGTFSGTQSMTRAQACTVIMRMMNLLNNYNPGDEDNDQHDDGESQNQGETAAAGKLTNGEDATVENVVAMLKEIEEKYPTGTPWGPVGTANNNWYIAPATSKARDVVTCTNKVGAADMTYACGGWAAMVSETIFGQSGAPAREVYSIKDARPGDLLYKIQNGRLAHVAIVTSVVKNSDDGTWRFSSCDGNINGKVSWTWNNEYGFGSNGLTNLSGSITYRIFTRYPD